jgi:hypothetical protein
MDELTMPQAARELGITRQRLGVIAKAGRLGRQIAGHYWLFTRAEVEAFKPNIRGKSGRPREQKRKTDKQAPVNA